MEKMNLRKKQGITLIALVVTIVVLLILAAISISILTGDNGLLNQAKKSKEDTEIAEEKETVELSAVQAAGEDTYGSIVEENLREQLDNNIGEGKYNLEVGKNKFKITYIDSNRSYYVDKDGNVEQAEIDLETGDISYLRWFVCNDEKVCLYVTTDSKIYLFNENNKICINDRFGELSEETNLRYYGGYTSGDSIGFSFISNKRVWNLGINGRLDAFNLENYTLQKEFDIETFAQGNYKDKNIRIMMEVLLLDDGNFYVTNEDSLEVFPLPSELQNMKFKNLSALYVNNSGIFTVIDENGKIYNFSDGNNLGENLSESLYNGYFENQNIKMTTAIQVNYDRYDYERYNVFITEEGKAYFANIETDEITCLNETIGELKDKHIQNIYTISNDFEENYIAIIMDDGTAYYTEDFVEFHAFDGTSMPELTIKYR